MANQNRTILQSELLHLGYESALSMDRWARRYLAVVGTGFALPSTVTTCAEFGGPPVLFHPSNFDEFVLSVHRFRPGSYAQPAQTHASSRISSELRRLRSCPDYPNASDSPRRRPYSPFWQFGHPVILQPAFQNGILSPRTWMSGPGGLPALGSLRSKVSSSSELFVTDVLRNRSTSCQGIRG